MDKDEELEIVSIPVLIGKGSKELLFEKFSEDERSNIFAELSIDLAMKICVCNYGDDKI